LPGGRAQDAVDCAGTWWVVGTIPGPGDRTRPAAWRSTDGRSWQDVTFTPLPGSYYGPQDVISSVGCTGTTVAMVGAKPGGAHGIPRVSTWQERSDGTMAEVAAPFESYGGDSAVNVGPIAGGPAGFMIAGNRTGGAAVWTSSDASAFELHPTAGAGTVARDAVAAADGQWVVVGGTVRNGSLDQAPAIWLGDQWQPAPVQNPGGYNELQRATRLGPDIVAAGPRGDAFGAWISTGATWTAAGTFGDGAGSLISLTAAGPTLYALVDAGSARTLWRSSDRAKNWQRVALPTSAPTAVAGRSGAVLLAAEGEVRTAAF
jgi:hypothetical protein